MDSATVSEDLYWLHMQLDGSIAFIALAVVFVVLKTVGAKLISRKGKYRNFDWDDMFAVATLAVFIPLCVFAIR